MLAGTYKTLIPGRDDSSAVRSFSANGQRRRWTSPTNSTVANSFSPTSSVGQGVRSNWGLLQLITLTAKPHQITFETAMAGFSVFSTRY